MTDAWIIDACRTPRGIAKPDRGSLAGIHPQQLTATVLQALATRNRLDTGEIDDIVWGTSAQLGTQGGDLARMAALDAGFDVRARGVTLDRFCRSGLTAAALAAATIRAGMEDLVIAGGTEVMSSFEANSAGTDVSSILADRGTIRLRSRSPLVHPGSGRGLDRDHRRHRPRRARRVRRVITAASEARHRGRSLRGQSGAGHPP